jgi:MoaA/NifB/PqqE/SkfB family radical SAM enzyme
VVSRSALRPVSSLVSRRREESFAWGRLLWRLGRRSRRALTECPERPIGAKLEITYACNLRCGFCYTDSPRRTLQRTPELSDEQWRRVVGDSLDLGIVEAVVTGGEPFLRRELTLEVIETLAGAGVGIALNTNGWFLDEEVAERLGAAAGVTAHVSIDGARGGLHDASRGVPGSWRRAIEGVDRLLDAGVGVCAVHVVTPANVDATPDFLEQMWTLGVPWVRMTPVIATGAAARGGDWRISVGALRKVAQEFEERRGTAMRIVVQPGTGGGIGLQGHAAPGSFLVRPNGDVRPDSLRPFTFGNAIADGVEACWAALRDDWDDERINRWAGAMKGPGDIRKSDLVPYLDDEVPIAEGLQAEASVSGRDAKVPSPTPPKPIEPATDLREARDKVRELALARRYRHAPLRWTGSPDQRFVRLAADGKYLRLNESGSAVMDALDGGTLGDAAEELSSRYGLSGDRAEEDAIAAARELQRRRVVLAADASSAYPAESGTTDLPGLEPAG